MSIQIVFCVLSYNPFSILRACVYTGMRIVLLCYFIQLIVLLCQKRVKPPKSKLLYYVRYEICAKHDVLEPENWQSSMCSCSLALIIPRSWMYLITLEELWRFVCNTAKGKVCLKGRASRAKLHYSVVHVGWTLSFMTSSLITHPIRLQEESLISQSHKHCYGSTFLRNKYNCILTTGQVHIWFQIFGQNYYRWHNFNPFVLTPNKEHTVQIAFHKTVLLWPYDAIEQIPLWILTCKYQVLFISKLTKLSNRYLSDTIDICSWCDILCRWILEYTVQVTRNMAEIHAWQTYMYIDADYKCENYMVNSWC